MLSHLPHLGQKLLLTLATTLVVAFAIVGCGGGTETVTVTETESSAPPSEETTKQSPVEEIDDESGPVAGYVDHVAAESDALALQGWAASSDLSEPATKVTASVGGKKVAEAVPVLERADVVEALGKPGLKKSGFELHLPIEALDCGAPAAGIKVVGQLGSESGPIQWGEGIKSKLSEVC